MAKKPKRISQIEREYNAQLRRSQNLVKSLQYQGYVFNNNVIPKRPQKITQASIRKLQRITLEKLQKKATSIFIDNDRDFIRGRKKTEYVPQAQINYLQRIYNEIVTYAPNPNQQPHIQQQQEEANNALLGLLSNAIARDGEKVVAQRLANSNEDIADIIQTIQYDSKSDKISHNIQRFAEIINGGRLDRFDTIKLSEFIESLDYMDEF